MSRLLILLGPSRAWVIKAYIRLAEMPFTLHEDITFGSAEDTATRGGWLGENTCKAMRAIEDRGHTRRACRGSWGSLRDI